jgi:amino acid transporter
MTFKDFKRILIGPPLPNKSISKEKLPVWKALAIFSSDALSSVAYGPEEMIVMLMVGGAIMYNFAIPIGIAIIVLVAIVSISYAQVAKANPAGGGSYSAAKSNIGEGPALVAAASLLVDYTLTVAVSVSSGTDAIVSAFPGLVPYHLFIDLSVLFLVLMIINLRGIRDSSWIFVFPTYAFIFGIIAMIVGGVFLALTGQHPMITSSGSGKVVLNGLAIFLLLRAFANGSSSMTGIEAISNGVPMFKKPEVKSAQKTTYLMASILITMFAGIVFLYVHYHFMPELNNTMLSQLASSVFGRGWFYYYIQIATMLILYLAANTAFNGLPPLLSILARDGYMPRYLSARGDRLSFSGGIMFLSFMAAAFIIIFHGNIDKLISLYSIGVFISFTIAQTAMVVHWRRERGRGWSTSAIINGFGAIVTATVVVVIIIAKFLLGAWIVVILIPLIIIWFVTVQNHYKNMSQQLKLPAESYGGTVKKQPVGRNIVIVPISGISRVVENTIKYAHTISTDVRAFYVSVDKESDKEILEKWKKWDPGVPLIIRYSPYRTIVQPIIEFIEEIKKEKNQEDFITVLIPEFETKRLWQRTLHNQTSWILRRYLVHETDVVISVVPFQLKK